MAVCVLYFVVHDIMLLFVMFPRQKVNFYKKISRVIFISYLCSVEKTMT